MADARMLPIIERLEKELGRAAWMEDYRALLRGEITADEYDRRRAADNMLAQVRIANQAYAVIQGWL